MNEKKRKTYFKIYPNENSEIQGSRENLRFTERKKWTTHNRIKIGLT